ncbi:hypothetical protein SORBI_3004G029500 [Sorghum bicolor]|uniref:Uncharacterized protein n=1 Tax=Sorghum bicolor TaxID=4558 RepID=A0A194YMD5_SORBI|nr:hypothetical protein SORBI_3004G029500 [Sorghum bicolor]
MLYLRTNMRSSGRGYNCVITIFVALFFGCFALPVIGRSGSKNLLRAEEAVGLAANITSGNIDVSKVNSTTTSGDESKTHLIFCTYEYYMCFHYNCYCCQKSDAKSCFKTQKECQAHCAACNPTCPPPARLIQQD